MNDLLRALIGAGETRDDEIRELFNRVQEWFMKLNPSQQIIDRTLVIRIRAYGRQVDKERDYNHEWRDRNPSWGPVPAGLCIYPIPVTNFTLPEMGAEIICDLREDSNGSAVINPMILGHESMHPLAATDRAVNPDNLINEETYRASPHIA